MQIYKYFLLYSLYKHFLTAKSYHKSLFFNKLLLSLYTENEIFNIQSIMNIKNFKNSQASLLLDGAKDSLRIAAGYANVDTSNPFDATICLHFIKLALTEISVAQKAINDMHDITSEHIKTLESFINSKNN